MSFYKGTLKTFQTYQKKASVKAGKCTCLHSRFSAVLLRPDSIALSEPMLSCRLVSVRKM